MGEDNFSFVFVSVFTHFPGTNVIYVISPVYWVPNDTPNALYQVAMKYSLASI